MRLFQSAHSPIARIFIKPHLHEGWTLFIVHIIYSLTISSVQRMCTTYNIIQHKRKHSKLLCQRCTECVYIKIKTFIANWYIWPGNFSLIFLVAKKVQNFTKFIGIVLRYCICTLYVEFSFFLWLLVPATLLLPYNYSWLFLMLTTKKISSIVFSVATKNFESKAKV